MPKITAIKDGKVRTFSEVAWNLLGKSHSGYVQVPDEATAKGNQSAKKSDSEDIKKQSPIEDTVKTSSDYTVDNAIQALKKLETLDEVDEFLLGETRVSLETVAHKYRASLVEKED